MTTAWSGDWKTIILNRIRDLGYETVTEYLTKRPGIPYTYLAEQLGRALPGGRGKDVAPAQIEALQYEEAKAGGTLRAVAMDMLVRMLNTHLLRKGWKEGIHAEFNQVSAFVSWRSLVSQAGDDTTIAMYADRTWEELEKLNPPVGWKPKDPSDPYIVEAFKRGWPLSHQ